MLRIGYHVSVAKSIDLAFDRAKEMGCTAMQLFVSNPRGWEVKGIPEQDAVAFVSKYRESDIDPVVAHMPYLPNLASAAELTYGKSMDSLRRTAESCSELGIKYLVTHLGSHLGKGREIGVKNVAEAINQAGLSKVKLLLENTAGHSNAIGSRLDELAEIYDKTSGTVGFCLDTCHLYAAGYDVAKGEVIDEIDEGIGFKNVHLFHLNDSKFGLGSHKDRHENIGKGFIGEDGFRKFLNFGKVRGKPLIMETPDPDPIAEIALVRRLAGNE